MGAETSLFKKCWIDSEVQYKCKDYSIFAAKYDSNKFSIFLFNDNNFAFDITHWKTIRHPLIVKYYDCGLFRGKRSVVTEWVQPVKPLLSQLSKELVISGLHNIAQSLAFIHSTCGLSVNNLSLDSIFVSRSESTDCWKLGSLLCLSCVDSETNDFSKELLNYHNYLGTTETLPAEDLLSNRIQFLDNTQQIHRRDAFALGLLMSQLLPDLQFSQTIQSLRSECQTKRPNMKSVLNDELFLSSEYVQIKSFLTGFVSYSETEKKQFFSDFVERLRKLSTNLSVSLVALIVHSRLIMSNSEVHNQFLPYVLIPANDSDEEILCELTSGESIALKPLLNRKVFKSRIIPLICKLYCIRELRIRSMLLQYLPNYASLLSNQCLRQLVLPQILLGMKDSNDQLVGLTFKAISRLVDIFGASVVLGPRLRLFSNGIPKLNEFNEGIGPVVNSNITESLGVDKSVDNKQMEDQNERNGWPQESNTSKENNDISVETINENKNKLLETKIIAKKSNKIIGNELDIKELDFNLDDNQIDSLFTDMEPVFKFSKNDIFVEPMDGFKTSNIFAANEDNIEEMGWTDHSWDNDWDKDN